MGNYVIHPADNVSVSLEDGHKYARTEIRSGSAVIKYGFPIGISTRDIAAGEQVHTHNMRTLLSGTKTYRYEPAFTLPQRILPAKIRAFIRKNNEIGIRNDVWIIPTVGCVNRIAQRIADKTGAFAFPHPYGCSQLGDDLQRTRQTLCALIRHPNAGGVLVLGLGCENNRIAAVQETLGEWDTARIRFLNAQDCKDEFIEGCAIIKELQALAANDERQEVPISNLHIGLKCGGSDGLSGITANPMCGLITDRLVAMGGTAVMTEVPEMFGAEQILMSRCVSDAVFEKTAAMINDWKNYFLRHGQPVSENPSPGNRDGGITTLEEKSLGCVQKGGSSPVTDVLDYGKTVKIPGLNLLTGPGNDMIAITNLTAAGCHLILFTTGRGTPLGAPVPTIKISSNSALMQQKPSWIDFDAQSECADALWQLILDTANGALTCSERAGDRQIALLKDNVTL